MKIIKYFFYTLYSRSVANEQEEPMWGMAAVSFFSIANIYTLFFVVLIIAGNTVPPVGKWLIIAGCIGVLYGNYAMLIRNGRAKKILEEFRGIKNKLKLNIMLALYILVSIVAFITLVNIIRERAAQTDLGQHESLKEEER